MALRLNTLDPMAKSIFAWFRDQPLVAGLLLMMALDIISGVLAAIISRRLSSSASWHGMSKKAFIWLIVGVGAVIEKVVPEIPATKMVCGLYLVTEGLSVLENAAMVGVPLPKPLVETLVKLKSETVATTQHLEIREASLVNIQGHGMTMPGDPITGPKPSRNEANDAQTPIGDVTP